MAVIPQNSIRARMVDLPANVGATINTSATLRSCCAGWVFWKKVLASA